MKREYHRWYSPRIGWDMGVVVYGHYGQPLIGFPTSAGDEWELVIPSSLGYGEEGAGADIGPNQTLVFDMTLVSVSSQ